MVQRCPLCHAGKFQSFRRIHGADLVRIYLGMGIELDEDVAKTSMIELCLCDNCGCEFFSPMLSGSPRFYEQLLNQPWYYPIDKSEFDFARGHIQPEDSVVEIGCGCGAFADKIFCKAYTGLEYTAASVSAARSRGHDVIQESIESYAARTGAIHDVVCFFQVLEHVSDTRNFLQSALQCLKPGGKLIISVPSADSFLSFAVNNVLNMPPHHVTRWSEGALRNLAEQFGLSIIDWKRERLADEHLDSYLQTLALMSLSAEHRRNPLLLDFSLTYKLKIRVAAKLSRWLAPSLAQPEMRPHGHSITFVYRKNG